VLLWVVVLVAFWGCRSAPSTRPGTAEWHLAVATAKQRDGDLRGALLELDRALQLDPRSVHALARRGALRAELHDLDGALEDFDRAVQIAPDNPIPYLGRGILRRQMDDLDGALEDHNQAVRLEPCMPEAYLARGATRAMRGDLRGGIDDFTRATALDSTFYRAYLWRAYAHLALDEYDQALSDLNTVREHAKDPVMVQRAEELLRDLVLRRSMGSEEP